MLTKHKWLGDLGENTLRRTLDFKGILADKMNPGEIRVETNAACNLCLRVLFGKSLRNATAATWGPFPFTTGRLTEAKANQILGFWAKHIEDTWPTLNFGDRSSLKVHFPATSAASALGDEVCLVDEAPRSSSGTALPSGTAPGARLASEGPQTDTGIRAGSRVKFLKRATLPMPLLENPDHKKDIAARSEACVIEVKTTGEKVKVKAELPHNGNLVECCGWVTCKMVKLLEPGAEPGVGLGSESQPSTATGQQDATILDVIADDHQTDHTCKRLTTAHGRFKKSTFKK